MTLQEYLIEITTKKPDNQRWGQWAMNVLFEQNKSLYWIIFKNGEFDIFEVDNTLDEKYVGFFEYVSQNW